MAKEKYSKIPRFIYFLLEIIYDRSYSVGYLGDILEEFEKISKSKGISNARYWLYSQILRSLPGMLFENIKWSLIMFNNYLKIGLRNINKNKGYSFINIFSLSIGITCTILIALFVNDEYTFDKHNKNYDNIYGLYAYLDFGVGRAETEASSTLAPLLSDKFPEIIDATRIKKENIVFSFNNNIFEESGLSVDQSFFNIFTTQMIKGNSNNVLMNPSSILLTKSMSQKYFGNENPIGKNIKLKVSDEFFNFEVTGVSEDCIPNSSIQFEFLVNFEDLHIVKLGKDPSEMNVPTFFLLNDNNNSDQLKSKFKNTIDEEFKEDYEEDSGYRLFKFSDFHLKDVRYTTALTGRSSESYSQILLLIGVLILALASFNYTNLSIGVSFKRFKEIGLRKVMGAKRTEIAKQFLFETILISGFSFLVGIIISIIVLPLFNQTTGKELIFSTLFEAKFIISMVILLISLGVMAGGYPALLISKVSSLELFRKNVNGLKSNLFSKILIMAQFSISILFVIGSIFIFKQHNYMLTMDLGYNKDKVIMLNMKNVTNDYQMSSGFFNNFKTKILTHSEINNVTGSSYPLGSFWMSTFMEFNSGEKYIVNYNEVDIDFIETLGLELIQGNNFRKGEGADYSIIINETLHKLEQGAPEGEKFSDLFNKDFNAKIIGVVKDFQHESLKKKLRPTYFKVKNDQAFTYIFIKFNTDNVRSVLKKIETDFQSLSPNIPFDYSFVDDLVAQQYELEGQWSDIIKYSSFLAILIACLGLFGLSVLIVNQRTKEIGIRKVLGASEISVMNIIFKEFGFWVAAANIIAWPTAYYALTKWLENFSYTIELDIMVFLLSGGFIFLAAMISVGAQSYKAALTNPVNTLRNE